MNSDEKDGGPEENSIGFAELLLSIATNAVAHLGGDPNDGRVVGAPDLSLAAQHIDILSMLKVKTRGNLTPSEEELIDSLLYDLRMRYVEVAKEQNS